MSSRFETAEERAEDKQKRSEDARNAWDDHERAAADERAKTERLRAARIAHQAEQEMRKKREGKGVAQPPTRARDRAARSSDSR